MEKVKPTYKIAVRSLVEHVLRSGDLRSDLWGSVQAIEGIRAHQQVQRRRPSDYESEITVQGEVAHTGFTLLISGRIDGVLRSDTLISIEEIKTTRAAFDDLEKTPNAIHWGQAQCYAYLLAKQENLESVEIRLTYVQPDSWTERTFSRLMTMEALEIFFSGVISRYLEWMTCIITWKGVRDESLQRLKFPFEHYREGQRTLAVEVYRTIRDEKQLIVQAATGIGKTMAVLFPAMKALGENTSAKVVFLTARTTGRLVAEMAFDLLRKNGARFKTITITAKDKICFNPESACLPEECPYAEGFYDRLGDALSEALNAEVYTREIIEALAEKYKICPFEFSLELVNWSDGVIGDYNYAFDPQVVLQRLFVEEGDKHIVLVDEAHNLVDRSREMFSAQLEKIPVLDMRRTLKEELPQLSKILARINSWMATARRLCREYGGTQVDEEAPSVLVDLIREFIARAEKWLHQNIKTPFRDDLITLFFNFVGFEKVSEQYNKCYTTIMETRDSNFTIRLFCIDPSDQLRQAWNRCRAAVLFSATLTPADYFQSVLGCSADMGKLRLPSPFPESNLMVLVAAGISTYYRQRKKTCPEVARLLIDLIQSHTGHYLFFFPSYEYLEMVYQKVHRGGRSGGF